MAGHNVKVSPVYWMGGYAVNCSKCGKIGRGVDKNRTKARTKAWTIAGNHRSKKDPGVLS